MAKVENEGRQTRYFFLDFNRRHTFLIYIYLFIYYATRKRPIPRIFPMLVNNQRNMVDDTQKGSLETIRFTS